MFETHKMRKYQEGVQKIKTHNLTMAQSVIDGNQWQKSIPAGDSNGSSQQLKANLCSTQVKVPLVCLHATSTCVDLTSIEHERALSPHSIYANDSTEVKPWACVQLPWHYNSLYNDDLNKWGNQLT